MMIQLLGLLDRRRGGGDRFSFLFAVAAPNEYGSQNGQDENGNFLH
jgi:hypothetical protein